MEGVTLLIFVTIFRSVRHGQKPMKPHQQLDVPCNLVVYLYVLCLDQIAWFDQMFLSHVSVRFGGKWDAFMIEDIHRLSFFNNF